MDRVGLSRWLIPLPAILFSLYPLAARAEPVAGLNAVGYKITGAPPTKSDTAYLTCGSETENNINRNFDGEPFQQCGADWFMVHYTGYIAIPANNTISFMVAADDGGTVKIGETEFGTWNNKGCSWSTQTTTAFAAGSYLIDGWFYEAGGLTCFMLAWNIDNQGWQIVPDSAFTTEPNATTTTTTSTTTTTTTTSTSTTTTTTTLPPSTTSSQPQTTSTTTLLQPTSTTTSTNQPASTTTTATTTTTVQVPTQTTTTTLFVPAATSTTATPTTQPPPQEAATAPMPQIETTAKTSSTTTVRLETTTLPQTLFTSLPIPETIVTLLPPVTSLPMRETTTTRPTSTTTKPTTSQPPATRPSTVQEAPNNITTLTATTSTISEIKPIAEPNTEQVLDLFNSSTPNLENTNLVQALNTVTDDQVDVVVGALLAQDSGATDQQALSLASSPQILENVDSDQADAIFEAVDESALTAAEGQAIVDAVSKAPDKVKSSFQAKINIFGGVFDDYVPLGSNVPVGVRRVMVAAGGTLTIVAAGRRAR